MQALKTLSYMTFAFGVAYLLLEVEEEYNLLAAYEAKTSGLILSIICYFILICLAYLLEPDIVRK